MIVRNVWRNCAAALMLVGAIAGLAPAQVQDEKRPAGKAAKPQKSPGKNALAKIGPEREAELLGFVREHHPELAELLDQLKPMKASEYETALRTLDKDVRRLDQLKTKSPNRYEPELALWASRSRIQLLSARLAMSEEDDELRKKLKDELRELRRHEFEVLQLEIDSVQQALDRQQRRLKQLEQQAAELKGDDEKWLARKLAALENEHRKNEASKDKSKEKKPLKPRLKSDSTLKAKSKSEPATGEKSDVR
jgi:hypothetical protein